MDEGNETADDDAGEPRGGLAVEPGDCRAGCAAGVGDPSTVKWYSLLPYPFKRTSSSAAAARTRDIAIAVDDAVTISRSLCLFATEKIWMHI